MTRFARAKGSKASNERKEEDATPWHVMRQQLADQLISDNAQKSASLSYNLKSLLNNDQDSKKEEVWCEFSETKGNGYESSSIVVEENKKEKREGKTYKKEKQNIKGSKTGNTINKLIRNIPKTEPVHLKTKSTGTEEIKKKNKDKNHEIINLNPGKKDTGIKKKRSKNTFTNNSGNHKHKNPDDTIVEKQNCFDDSRPEFDSELPASTHNCSFEQLNCNGNSPVNKSNQISNHNLTVNKYFACRQNDKFNKSKKHNSFSNWKNYDNSHTIIVNGREIKVVSFEGFFIKKDDAAELKTLRKKLRAQNIPKEQIKAVIKLERRKAEKALTREKNKVCFHCRKFGHNFSDCPDIKDTESSKSGICFKCGSMEHSHFQCKVLQSQDFRYAVCFVCKDQGHIARQCPLNPQGQYPKGGSCHLCGEVTHLRKDCPKAIDEKTSNSFTVEKLQNNYLEDISEVTSKKKKQVSRKNKVITF